MNSTRFGAVEALPRLPLGEMLVQRGLISEEDLQQALEHQSQSLKKKKEKERVDSKKKRRKELVKKRKK